jgi:hypothetical protein
MSSPLVSPEFENLFVGDAHDDDGRVIDSLVQEVDAPATPVVERIAPMPLIEPKRTTRILSGSFNFSFTLANAGGYAPVQILPADANRQDMTIKAYSSATTLTDFMYIADENGKLGTSSAGRLRPGSADFDVTEHTGAVWVLPNTAITADFEINWWATTL